MPLKYGEQLLGALGPGERRSASEISAELGLPLRAVYRTLTALYSQRLVNRDVSRVRRPALWWRPDGR